MSEPRLPFDVEDAVEARDSCPSRPDTDASAAQGLRPALAEIDVVAAAPSDNDVLVAQDPSTARPEPSDSPLILSPSKDERSAEDRPVERRELGTGFSPTPTPAVDPVDGAARAYAVNPAENVVLEASAGTGKTRVLVDRYVNLLAAGVDPEHILAITFTRKAAAEMRQRIVERLKEASRTSTLDAARWRDLRGRLGDIAISTIDAFCLALLREFPLEADVDPAFELADETEVPRLIEEALDRSLRICRAMARDDDDVALVFAQLGERRLRPGLAALLNRRLVAPALLRRYLADGPRDLTAAVACRTAAERIVRLFAEMPGGLTPFLASGPIGHPQFALLAADIAVLAGTPIKGVPFTSSVGHGLQTVPNIFDTRAGQAAFRALADRLRGYFLTQDGKPRGERFTGTAFRAAHCDSEAAWKQHRAAASAIAPAIATALGAFRRDLNIVLSRGVWRMFAVTTTQYRRALDARALLDFSGVLERAVDLLKQMDEFARSRYRLESRYHHVLVDEFQDTSRAQWDLVEQLIRSWSEGLGASADALPPSIFIVGDRKQAIYGFRDAEVALLDEAARFIAALRPPSSEVGTRRALSVSFRSASPLLGFVNDVFGAIEGDQAGRPYAFRYGELDRFPLPLTAEVAGADAWRPEPDDIPLGLVVGTTVRFAAEAVADEIVRLLNGTTVRDKGTGIVRVVQPADIAILFRSRESHREFEAALERRGVSTYVYKGLGFFEADEIQDAVAVLRYLADPTSNLRAAAFLRSRLVRLSDDAIKRLAPRLADAILNEGADGEDDHETALAAEDRIVLSKVRDVVRGWLSLVDRMTPGDLLDAVLAETAYGMEIRGPRRPQARENLKKLRGLIRRIQNRGYATLARIADHFERLAVGDESNAAIDAVDAVSLMTVHAAKGLEFPVVFVVNIGRGTGGARAPIRITTSSDGAPSVAIADFQSEADEEAQVREREETKRLLYVALTRARDRLYLSATAEGGTCRTGRGSLGDVLPKSLVDLLAAASGGTEVSRPMTWAPAGGREHTFFAQRYDPSAAPRVLPPRDAATPSVDDFGLVE
jgi:ATP-dependent helicase/nuclease subunit A